MAKTSHSSGGQSTDHPLALYDAETSSQGLKRFGVGIRYCEGYVNLTPSLHAISTVLISFIVRGRGSHVMGDTVYEESGGSLGITYYDEVHAIATEPEGMDIYNIFVDPERFPLPLLPPPFRDVLHVILPQHRAFRTLRNRAVHLDIRDPQPLAAVAKRMCREIEDPRDGAAAIVAACLRIFLIECCRAAIANGFHPALPTARAHPVWIDRLCRHIDHQFAEPLSLDEFQKLTGLSAGHLCRTFKRHTGQRVFDYVIDRRLQAAMPRLRGTDAKIRTIALECGFNDASYFSRRFQERLGLSPSDYRRGME
ncbi:MAG: helix-turn-helix transcriptional regulator [Lentisphaerae bacterium]|nr:helix-turn-helix transcriptional regulator [Lentisphaerota bacterium]